MHEREWPELRSVLYSLLTAMLSLFSRLLLQDNKEGSSCAFTCNDGYHMSAGSATRKCTTATSTSFDGTEVICSMCPIGKYKDSPTTCATLTSLGGSSTSGGSTDSTTTGTTSSANTTVTTDDQSARITALESTQSILAWLSVVSLALIAVLFSMLVVKCKKAKTEVLQQEDAKHGL